MLGRMMLPPGPTSCDPTIALAIVTSRPPSCAATVIDGPPRGLRSADRAAEAVGIGRSGTPGVWTQGGRNSGERRWVPGAGFEPARPFGQWILSPPRLPFRHPGQRGDSLIRASGGPCSAVPDAGHVVHRSGP
jgi:hypothetical protein